VGVEKEAVAVVEERFDPCRPTLDLLATRREHERIVAKEGAAGRYPRNGAGSRPGASSVA
jgi:hypothetical protein